MPPLNRDTCRNSRRTKTVPIEALGDDAILREFSAAERLTVVAGFRKAARDIAAARHRQAKATAGEVLPDVDAALAQAENLKQHMVAQIIQLSLIDEHGERLYADDEVDNVLADLNDDALREISNEAMSLNGFGENAPDPKASAETTSDAGNSDSA